MLRAIFGDKAGDVKDASMKLRPSTKGVVIDKELFARAKKNKESKEKEKAQLAKLEEHHAKQSVKLRDILIEKLTLLLLDKRSEGITNIYNEEVVPIGIKFSQRLLADLDYEAVMVSDWTDEDETNRLLKQLLHNYNIRVNEELARHKRAKYLSLIHI